MLPHAFLRKARRLFDDPILRRWLVAYLTGRAQRPAPFVTGWPPYLGELPQRDNASIGADLSHFDQYRPNAPAKSLVLDLPGETITVPGDAVRSLFERGFDDIETLLAVHRFAWVPMSGNEIDPDWVDVIWREWLIRFAVPDSSWAWHPYTASERAINILEFAQLHGMPGDRHESIVALERHVHAIIERLEYFGDHNTGNHLSNNGRGLYLLGLALGMRDATDIGLRILLGEAKRIFQPSGILREGSTHYHLLLTRNYASAWFAARRYDRSEARDLEDIVRHTLSVIPMLTLPGGLPLIGDISPDCLPKFLFGLLPSGNLRGGWCDSLAVAEKVTLRNLMSECSSLDPDTLADDGWIRLDVGSWAGLWHVPNEGWAPIPSHAHQDIGSFELHFAGECLFIDPGRGAYGETGEAAFYTSAAAHNSLTINGQDPYPPNKPYYDERFRRSVGGLPPRVERRADGLSLAFQGFGRLGGVGEVERDFTFTENGLAIVDEIEGTSSKFVVRRLYTPMAAERDGTSVVLSGVHRKFRIVADDPIEIAPAKRWIAYGISVPATVLEISCNITLPARLALSVVLI